jgi:Histidine kinase/Histidine kinase-, DNA gyrase B-, and HSP90-like ATPase
VEPDREGALLDAVFEAAPIGMGQVDTNGRLFALNAEFGRAIGVPLEFALNRPLHEIAPPLHDLWQDILSAGGESPGFGRRTLAVPEPRNGHSLDVVGWVAAHGGGVPFVVLLVSDLQPNGSAAVGDAIERSRVAREIHDGLAQELWLAKLTASKLARHPTLDADGRAMCVDLLRSIDAGLTEARTAVMAMRSADETTIALAELVERQVDEFSERFGIRAECHVQDGQPIVARTSVEMLRILQEALNNVRKHARARRVVVRMAQRRSSVLLSVRDDGTGFDPRAVRSGFGRQSMSERAQSVGGRLTIASRPGRGTTVTLLVPVPESGAPR